jgi:hypothetical protein
VNIYEARRLVAERLDAQVAKAQPEDVAAKTVGLAPRSGEGDPKRLRGVPCIANGVSGHIPGSDPLEALLEKYPEGEEAV